MSAFTRRILAASLGGAALAMLLSAAGPKDGESLLCPVADAQDKAGGKKTWKYYGSATCNGASCHASSKMMDERPANEYLTWQSKDRHAKAFNSLFNEDSQYWCEELKIADASKDKRCTECHTTEVPKELQGQKYNREDGVSCDGCHGPAEGWFEPHTKEHKYEDMLKLGMWDTRNMYVRADMCAKCHLQIEPELVDVGHPDLSFELIAHSLREPPHWYERQTWDGIRSWSVGQAVSLRECFRKLKRRIDNKKAPYSIEIAAAQTSSYLGVFRHGVAVLGDDATKKLVAEADKLLNARKLDHAKLAEISARAADSMDAMAKKLAAYDGFSKEQCKQIALLSWRRRSSS